VEAAPLLEALEQILPKEKIRARLIDRYAFASDASFYYMIPQVVVMPDTVGEIRSLFGLSQRMGIPMTFRAAGTSLSGQAVTDGILVDLSRNWRKLWVEDEGWRIRVQPGVIGGHANNALRRYGRKIGPDPASINAAMMGGILSNNASGMCCGVAQNAYHTLESMTLVLPNGQSFDTNVPTSYTRFEREAKDIFDGIRKIRRQILEDPDLVALIRQKYRTKNTVGYGLNAFLDYEHPLDIIARLMIGGEGTLGFIAEAVLVTVPDYAHKATGILYFPDAASAGHAIPILRETGAAALELMDGMALKSIAELPEAPEILKTLPDEAVGLLCEYHAPDVWSLDQAMEIADASFLRLRILNKPKFSRNPVNQAKLWKLRKGLYPSAAALRGRGEAVLLEDITFPVEKLGEAIPDLQKLLHQHGYPNPIIFGHAKDGNLHFVVSQPLEDADIGRYALFMEELSDLVLLKYGGSLKAEHGTGRNIAPFVEAEWGVKAYSIMKQVKRLLDPDNLLNPGVILNNDKAAHIRNLKSLPVVETEVDKCVECGFCENRCPSRDFTLSPRQRIGIRRAIRRLEATGKHEEVRQLRQEYRFDGLETCAVDGLCALDCPVGINTGDLVKRLRREGHSRFAQKMALQVAQSFRNTVRATRFGLQMGGQVNRVLGRKAMERITGVAKKLNHTFPKWSDQLQTPPELIAHTPVKADAVYFATCITRTLGDGEGGKPSLLRTFIEVAERAGVSLFLPTSIGGYCCSQIFSSKGYTQAQEYMANYVVEALYQWTEGGKLPVVLDVSSCTQALRGIRPVLSPRNQRYFDSLTIYDSIEFIAEYLLPRLDIRHKKHRVALHPVCSLHKMGTVEVLEKVAQACALHTFTPEHAGCCGMAGDRGFVVPGLTAAATAREVEELHAVSCDGYYATSRPCELSLGETSGLPFESILYLLEEVTRP